MPMPSGVLSNVPMGTANFLAYAMMGLVVFFLVFGPAVTYYLWKKNTRTKATPTTAAASPHAGS